MGRRTWITVLLTAMVTTAACLLIATATGFATQRAGGNVLTMQVGDLLIVPGVDLSCDLFKTDPDHHDTGPLLFCNRNSVANNPKDAASISASFGASRFHLRLEPPGSRTWKYTVTRSP